MFNSHDYPDDGSGSVSEALLSPATETFIELDVTSFYSSDEIRAIRLDKRKCIFQDELPVLYTGYTYSDCLVDCRAAAIWDTCQCRPFYLPRRGNDQCEEAEKFLSEYSIFSLFYTFDHRGSLRSNLSDALLPPRAHLLPVYIPVDLWDLSAACLASIG